MPSFFVKLSAPFIKSVDRLPKNIASQIYQSLRILQTSPIPLGKTNIKKISGFKPPLFRLRSGDYRVLYRLVGREVVVLKLVDRKELERELKKMLR